MKQGAMIIFFSVVLVIYTAVNWYVFSRGMKALDATSAQKPFIWVYWIITSFFIIGQILERGNPGILSRIVSFIGSYWLAIFLYLLILVVAIDLIRIIQHLTHFIPQSLLSGIFQPQKLFIYTASLAFIIALAGFYNAKHPIIKEINLTIPKKDSQLNELKLVVVTDVHLGVLLQVRTAKRLANDINAQNPDLVIFGGDLVDHNPIPVIENNLGKYLEAIKAPMGIYAVAGNHEYIGHVEKSVNYFQKHGIEYIRDSIKTLENKLQIIGRNDRESKNYTGENRKSLDVIMQNSGSNLPSILIDHQPVEYTEAEKHNIDLMLSGHTHKGQLWPFGYITKMVFENDFGLIKKGNTTFYTSNGYGTWGPPVRTGNRPELIVFNIKFQ